MSDVDLDAHRICNADHGRVACYCSALDWMTLDQYGEHVEAIAAQRVRVAEAAVARGLALADRVDADARKYQHLARLGTGDLRDALTTPTPESAVRVGDLQDSEVCYRCAGENVVWAAPSPLWNLVMRDNDINGDPQYGDLVCVRCFIVLAAEKGVVGRWRVSVDPEPDGLILTTPSGRTWDAKHWLWIDPTPESGTDTCPTSNCEGDPRYAAPGRRHREGCTYPLTLESGTDEGSAS